MPDDGLEVIFRTPRKTLVVGPTPAVVGTISSAGETPGERAGLDCDIAEFRLDQMPGVADWLERCQAIEAGGTPVILTARHKDEGGKWDGSETKRGTILERALEHLAAVDVELRSGLAAAIGERARQLGKVCIVSYHDFGRTPSIAELEAVVARARAHASIVKIAAIVTGGEDIETLRALLARKLDIPLCVIGMGPLGMETRFSFAAEGSCLAYGYLDKSAAPGQLPASTLVSRLRALHPLYDKRAAKRAGA